MMQGGSPQLVVRSISKQFAGYRALDDVSFEVRKGDVHALIGPNGAGKTTLLNVISGLMPPTTGQVFLNGEDISGLPPHRRARLRIGRTFQRARLSSSLLCWEEVALTGHVKDRPSLFSEVIRVPFRKSARDHRLRSHSFALLEEVGLAEFARSFSGDSLTLDTQRRLEIARALAMEPQICLTDEPTSGMTRGEAREVRDLIASYADRGTTVLLVAHDMDLVMDVSDRITVLNGGKKIAEGTVDEIRSDPVVIAAYLGKESEDADTSP